MPVLDLPEPCPDCGDDPNDPSLHKEGCPRIGDDDLQFGPPWHGKRDIEEQEEKPDEEKK